MGSLVLVRHAQASFFDADYDVLCPIGEEQSRRLGDYWAALGLGFDEVYTGPRVRHRRTAELVGARLKQADLAWPEPVTREAFDEHSVDRLLRESVDSLCADHPHLGALAQAYAGAESRGEKQKTFQKLFEALVRLWCAGACAIPGADDWPTFRDGVCETLAGIVKRDPAGRRVAVFTSVGPISAALGWVLKCPDEVGLEMGWRLRNASLTEIVFTRGRVTLDGFNALPHLDQPELCTFR
jgi:broad specificity phosphatase PhoE